MKGKVDHLKEFNIEFKGLKEGKHFYNYSVEDKFFKDFENSLIEKGNIKANVLLIKQSTYLTFEIEITGKVTSVCDRCLDPVIVSIKNKGTVYVKFGEEFDDNSDEVIILPHEEHAINVAQLIYEFIALAMPMQVIHSNSREGDKCNNDMLLRLKNMEDNLNHNDDETTDPRWNELKKLIDKNK